MALSFGALSEKLWGPETDFLLETPQDSVVSKTSKDRRAKFRNDIRILKSEITTKHDLIENYYAQVESLKKKDNEIAALNSDVAHLKQEVLTLTENLKQSCIQKTLSERKQELTQQENKILQNKLKKLEQRVVDVQNQNAASDSYSKQLQQLIHERDKSIENLDKKILFLESTLKHLEKSNFFYKKYNTHLHTTLCNVAGVAFRKRTLTKKEKIILSKYMRKKRQGTEKATEEECIDGHVSKELDTFIEDIEKDLFLPEDENPAKACLISNNTNDDIDGELDTTSEKVSVDTGRGSSLALDSPEYHVDSPDSHASSDTEIEPVVTSILNHDHQKDNHSAQFIPMVDHSIMTIKEKTTKPEIIPDTEVSKQKSMVKILRTPEKSYIESNNIANFYDDNIINNEVETILNAMRQTKEFITPIPPTPVQCLEIGLNSANSAISNINKIHTMKQTRHDLDVPENEVMGNQIPLECIQKETTEVAKHHGMIEVFNHIDESVVQDSDCEVIYQIIQIEDEEQNKPLIHEADKQNMPLIHEAEEQNMPLIPTLQVNLVDTLQFENTSDINVSQIYEEKDEQQETNDVVRCDKKSEKKIPRAKKLTPLNKLKNKFLPKSKIKKVDLPLPRKLRSSMKPISVMNNRKTIHNIDSAVTLNTKEVYEKAVKVMAELNSKRKSDTPKSFLIRRNKVDKNVVGGIKETKISSFGKACKEIPSSENIHKKNATDTNVLELISTSKKKHDDALTPSMKAVGAERRKSLSPAMENLLAKSRKRYPSLCFEKDIRIVLNRSEIHANISQTNIGKNINNTTVDTTEANTINLQKHASENSDQNTRILRSAVRSPKQIENCNNDDSDKLRNDNHNMKKHKLFSSGLVSYEDLNLFNDAESPPCKKQKEESSLIQASQASVLCNMIEKYSVTKFRNSAKQDISDSFAKTIHKKIEDSIARVIELPLIETKDALNKIVEDVQKWKFNEFLSGLMLYLTDSNRKIELYNKVNVSPAPPMTKSEQVLLYIVTKSCWVNIDTVDSVLNKIEYTLFRLNQNPHFDVVESLSHFYAVLCRYVNAKSRLRAFVLDAMYCLQYKAVTLIKQCIEVWMNIFPLAHMGQAKSPLVTCLVYLLYYYKCEDRFNKVQEIRNILRYKYFFDISSEWNEKKILEMLKNAILAIKSDPTERKMLRLALILISKRHGAKWCQNHIIKGMLMPIILKTDIPERARAFCVSMLGPLLKPFPVEMKVHCEITMNQIMDMLNENLSSLMKEGIYSSLIYMSKHNPRCVIRALLSWKAEHISPEMENILKDYVKEKTLKAWKTSLKNIPLVK